MVVVIGKGLRQERQAYVVLAALMWSYMRYTLAHLFSWCCSPTSWCYRCLVGVMLLPWSAVPPLNATAATRKV